jgi:uncharacterized protein YjiS (DUF1127 family)
MEMIMSTTFSMPPAAEGMARQPSGHGLVATLKSWWLAHLARRIERAAIIQLGSMSDRELKDIGLTRSRIAWAVRGEPGPDAFGRYC